MLANNCPSCGNSNVYLEEFPAWKKLIDYIEPNETPMAIECSDCGTRGMMAGTDELAIKFWNNLGTFNCNCKEPLFGNKDEPNKCLNCGKYKD